MMKIRQRKDGGLSLCSSPDEMVGKGRCIHVPDGQVAADSVDLISRGLYLSEVDNEPATEKDFNKTVTAFFNTLGTISIEKQRRIINILSAE